MDKDGEYQRNAQHCQRMADATKNAGDKNQWLRLAQSWLQLIQRRKRAAPTREDAFDEAEASRATGQEESKSSH